VIKDEFYISFKRLITFEGVSIFTVLTMFFPFPACGMFVAVPAELNAFFIDGARDKGAAHRHPRFAFTAQAAAGSTGLITGTKDAGEAAYSHSLMVDVHGAKLYPCGLIWASIGGLIAQPAI
jgi:hypothetical protein